MFSGVLDGQSTECAYGSYINQPSRFGYDSNNQYPGFPAMMKDGRSLISSWGASSVETQSFKQSNQEDAFNISPLSENWAYRRMMQKNGMELMKSNFENTANDAGISNPSSILPSTRQPNHAFAFDGLSDNSRPAGYQESDLKDLYLSREQLNSQLYAPKIN
jgi:hypothetical protein